MQSLKRHLGLPHWLFLASMLALPAHQADAQGYSCERRDEQAIDDFAYRRESVAILDKGASAPLIAQSAWTTTFGGVSGHIMVRYEGTPSDPWRATSLQLQMPVDLSKPPSSPLFLYLTLDTGERSVDQIGNSKGEFTWQTNGQPFIGRANLTRQIKNAAFLSKLKVAHSLAADLIYSDGKVLFHKVYNVIFPEELMENALKQALALHANFKLSCRNVSAEPEL